MSLVSFCGIDIETDAGVLVPRAETELLARTAIELGRELGATRIIDMCCGAGNLVCALAHALPVAHAWASDLTDECVGLARRNVERLRLGGRVEVRQGDLFTPLLDLDPVDLVVCNPPYISTGRLAKESAHLLEHEPREAFDGGPYGLTIHQRVIADAPRHLRPGGWLAFEIGAGQARQLEILFKRATAFSELRQVLDEAGVVRVVVARRVA